ncbi:MAG: hypothetical protein V2A76_14335, partial [Planctomycetota bacterium]
MPAILLVQPDNRVGLQSLYDMLMNGGPIMVPIALCSVIALAYIVERSIRLRSGRLGSRRFGGELLEAVKSGGAQQAIAICDAARHPLARILSAGLKRNGAPLLEVEKAVEDAGSREVRRLS